MSVVATGWGTAVLAAAALLVVGALAAPLRRPSARVPPSTVALSPTRRPVDRVVLVGVLALVAGAAVAAVGPFAVVATGALVATLIQRRRRRLTVVRRRALDVALPDAVELLVLCVHAGCSPTQAVLALAARAPPALGPVLAEIELRLHRGHTLAEALRVLAATGPLGRDVAQAIAAADRDGLPLAPVLDRLAAAARAARRRLGEADARRLPVRLTFPLVTCTLPSFVLLTVAPAVLGALSTLRTDAL
jgi:Flp pilus assembly protein TadB